MCSKAIWVQPCQNFGQTPSTSSSHIEGVPTLSNIFGNIYLTLQAHNGYTLLDYLSTHTQQVFQTKPLEVSACSSCHDRIGAYDIFQSCSRFPEHVMAILFKVNA